MSTLPPLPLFVFETLVSNPSTTGSKRVGFLADDSRRAAVAQIQPIETCLVMEDYTTTESVSASQLSDGATRVHKLWTIAFKTLALDKSKMMNVSLHNRGPINLAVQHLTSTRHEFLREFTRTLSNSSNHRIHSMIRQRTHTVYFLIRCIMVCTALTAEL